MINFNKDSAFDLKPISIAEVRDEVNGLLIAGEEIARDQNDPRPAYLHQQAHHFR